MSPWDHKKGANVLRGRTAQAVGASWEHSFQSACTHHGIVATQIPSGCRWVSSTKAIPQKTPFDWVLTLQGHTILADTKTCNHNTFPHSNIDPHQVRKLVRHDTAPTKAGYLIWLRKPDVVLYAPSTHLFAIMDTRGGIAPDDPNIKNLGSFSDMALRSLFI